MKTNKLLRFKRIGGTAAEWEAYARRKAIRQMGKKNPLADMDTDTDAPRELDHDKGKWDFDGSD